MKKTLTILGIVVLALVLLTTVAKAATKEELVSFLTQSHEVAGKTVRLTETERREVERYFDTYSVTAEQADAVIASVKQAITVMNNAGTAKVSKLTTAQKATLTSIKNDIEETLDATINVEKTGASQTSIVIYGPDGVKFTAIPVPDGNPDSLVDTGANYTVYIVASVLAIFAVATVIIANRKRTVNA